MNKKKKKKKYHLKTGVKRFLIVLLFIIGISIYGSKEAYSLYLEYEYKKTNEYKLLEIGYKIEEINVFNTLPEDKINYLLNNEYNEIYYNLITQKYYLDKNFYKYIDYKIKNVKLDYKDVITLVNVHANSKWYMETYDTDISKEYSMLVNKFYKLGETYERNDLVDINLKYSYSGQRVSQVVASAYDEMWNDVKSTLNVHLMVNSSYRSYSEQNEIYEDFKKISQKHADSYAARPGYSEHQTGLAIDITSLEHPLAKDFTTSEEYNWLKENSYKYGFILRYPEGKDNITGYSTESWHFRYVGKTAAKQIYEEGITLDEYYAYYVEK